MSFFGINLASRTLQAQQQALEVVGQNITNVDVPGYSRQVAILRSVPGAGAEVLDQSGNPVAPGGGIDVALVQRSHAAWLDDSAARLRAQAGRSTAGDRAAKGLETLLAEPSDTGLNSTLDRFVSAFGTLANRPDEPAARDAVVRAGQALADRFTQLTSGIDSLKQDVTAQARDNIAAVNDLAKQVASLSRQIGQAQAAGAQPNELLDQRDQLVQQIVQRTGAAVSGQQGSEVVVSLGGVALVQGEQAGALELAPGSGLSVVVQGTGQPITSTVGELAAQQEWVNTLLPGYKTRLSGIRDSLGAAVNSLHQSGRDATGAAGLPFFTANAAGELSVNPALVADSRKVVAGDGTAGSGGVALSIAGLGTTSGSAVPQYRQLVAEIGSRSADSSHAVDQSQASLRQIRTAQASESGVNLDEELAQMVSLQHAYSASARLLSTYDQMLSTLIQGTAA